MNLNNLPTGNVKGIDVSSYKGKIEWSKVENQGIKFAILRSVLRSGNLDAFFESNYSGAKSAGLEVDVYQFSYALNAESAINDARNLIAKLNGKQVGIWLDLEWTDQGKLGKDQVTEIAIAYINECKCLGYQCNIYSNTVWYQNYYHADKLKDLGCKFWIAKYGVNDGVYDEARKPNLGEFIWQYTSRGKVDGISGNVDLNMMYVEGGVNMANTVDKVIALAREEEGYIEKASNAYLDSETANKGSNNYQKYSRDINAVGLKGYQGQPWCASANFWLDLKCFGKETALRLWNMTEKTYVGFNCFSTYNTFKSVGKVGMEPKLGALVIFTFSHMGRVLDIYEKNGKKYIEIWEGNTSSNVNDRNGGMVVIRERYAYDSTIKGYCYIDYDETSSENKYTKGWNKDSKGWWYSPDGNTYYKSGIYQIGNKKCYFNDAGYAVTGWFQYNGNWYYADENCYIETSKWIHYANKDWYLLSDGKMATNCYVLSADKRALYYINSAGEWDSSKDLSVLNSENTVFVSK